MKKCNGILMLFICALLVFCVLFSSLVLASHGYSHHCLDNECLLCSVIKICEEVFRIIYLAIGSFLVSFGALIYSMHRIPKSSNRCYKVDPVAMKVKLLN